MKTTISSRLWPTLFVVSVVVVASVCNVGADVHQASVCIGPVLSSIATVGMTGTIVAKSYWRFTSDEASTPLEVPSSAPHPITSWRIGVYDLKGEVVLRLDLEVLDTATNGVETSIWVLDPAECIAETDSLDISNCPNPRPGLQYPLLRFQAPASWFQVDVYDSKGKKIQTVETQRPGDIVSNAVRTLAAGIYLYQVQGRTANQWYTLVLRKLVVLR